MGVAFILRRAFPEPSDKLRYIHAFSYFRNHYADQERDNTMNQPKKIRLKEELDFLSAGKQQAISLETQINNAIDKGYQPHGDLTLENKTLLQWMQLPKNNHCKITAYKIVSTSQEVPSDTEGQLIDRLVNDLEQDGFTKHGKRVTKKIAQPSAFHPKGCIFMFQAMVKRAKST